jgi:hypothetical protein
MAVIINKGQRTYHLSDGPNKEKRALEPGASIEVSAEEAKPLLAYDDIVDASEVVPQNTQEIERLRAENARLKAEQETLKGSTKQVLDDVPHHKKEPKPQDHHRDHAHAGKAHKPEGKKKGR